MATLADVARKAGVALSTVSGVLNNRSDCFVSPRTRQRILQAARELGYHPNYLARSLARGKTETIGLILYEVANPFFAQMADEVEKAVRQAGYQLLLCTTHDGSEARDRAHLELLSAQRVDGILLWASRYPVEGYTVPLPDEVKKRVAIVVLGYHTADGTDYVSIDREAGTYQAARHLIALGHRRIGYLAPSWGMKGGYPKLEGIKRALKEEGLPEPLLMVAESHTRTAGRLAMRALGGQSPWPTALICCNDLLAIGAYWGLRDMGLLVPEDVALIGFDGIEEGEYAPVPLTTVVSPVEEMCQTAVRFLLQRLEGKTSGPQQAILTPSLVVRRSCGAPRPSNGGRRS